VGWCGWWRGYQKATDEFSKSVSKIVLKESTGFFDSISESMNDLAKKSNTTP